MRNEAVEWAQDNGWKAVHLNSGHIELTHDQIPREKITVAATPSDKRAFQNAVSRVRAAMLRNGLEWDVSKKEQKSRRRQAREQFRFGKTPEGAYRYIIKCRECGTEDEFSSRPGSALYAPWKAAQKFERMGWRVGQARTRDVCPDCLHKALNPTLPPALVLDAQSAPQKSSLTEELIISLPAGLMERLDALMPLWGCDREDVVRSLVMDAIRRVEG